MLRKLIRLPRELYRATGLRSNCRPTRICWSLNLNKPLLAFLIAVIGLNLLGPNGVAAANVAKAKPKLAPAVNKQKFVSGVLFNVPFQMVDAFVSPKKLLIRTGLNAGRSGVTKVQLSYRQSIELTFPQPEKLEGQTFAFKSYEKQMFVDNEVQPSPVLMLNVLEDKYPELIQPTDPYTIALTFYKASKGMLPGFIDLESYGTYKTHLRGYFYAKLTR